MGERLASFRDLHVYQAAFRLQQAICEWSKTLPRDERYAVMDQIRRASRAVGANIAEAWQKRRYPAHVVSKLTDADAELAETWHWLHTADACGHIESEALAQLLADVEGIGRMLGRMMKHPEPWCP